MTVDSLPLAAGRERPESGERQTAGCGRVLRLYLYTQKMNQRGWNRCLEKAVPVEGLEHAAVVLQTLADTYAERFFLRFPAYLLTRGRSPVRTIHLKAFLDIPHDPRYQGLDSATLTAYRYRKGCEPQGLSAARSDLPRKQDHKRGCETRDPV